jgi:hypothetical protein
VVTSPSYQYDRAISQEHIEKVTYENVECIVEMKARLKKGGKRRQNVDPGEGLKYALVPATDLHTNGQGQAISYLSAVCFRAIENNNNISSFRISVFFNGDVIAFFRFVDCDPQRRLASGLLKFSHDTLDASPSRGFVWLYSYLVHFSSRVCVDHVKLADGLSYQIVSTFAANSVQVHMVKGFNPGERFIVKTYAIAGKHNRSLEMERSAFDYLKANSNMTLLNLHENLSDDNCLVYSPVGITFPEFLMQMKTANTDSVDVNCLKRILLAIVDQVDAMHQIDVCHADIRPQNIVLLDDDRVCLIDFETALFEGERLKFNNRSHYSSNRLIQCTNPACFVYSKKDDWESLCYSFLFCLSGRMRDMSDTPSFVYNRRNHFSGELNISWCKDVYRSVLDMLQEIDDTPSSAPVNVAKLKSLFGASQSS